MKNLILLSFLILTFFSCNTSGKLSSKEISYDAYFKKTAAQQFLILGEKMLRDEEPSDEEWKSFFQTESMQIVFDNHLITQMNGPTYKQLFRFSFLPSKSDSLKILRETPSYSLDHFLEIKKHLPSYKALLSQPQSHINYAQALELVKEYLPPHFHNKTVPPNLHFVFYNPQNQGLKKGILIDLEQFRKNIEEEKTNFTYGIGHEMHHYFTINNSDFDPIETMVNLMQSGSSDLMPIWFLLNSHYESFAQQIDIPFNDYGNDFMGMVKEVPTSISVIDSMMSSVYTKKEDEFGMGAWAERLPDSAHPFGFYMYQQLAKNCPKEQILATVDNPFKFFELYQKNIKEKNLKFSKETMAYIAELEDRYFKK